MSADIEKNRADYVTHLEAQLQHSQAELAKFKVIAEKWQPIVYGELDADKNEARFTLQFGGSRCTATIAFNVLKDLDVTSAVTGIVNVLIESMAADKLKEPLRPEVERLMPNLQVALLAGKW